LDFASAHVLGGVILKQALDGNGEFDWISEAENEGKRLSGDVGAGTVVEAPNNSSRVASHLWGGLDDSRKGIIGLVRNDEWVHFGLKEGTGDVNLGEEGSRAHREPIDVEGVGEVRSEVVVEDVRGVLHQCLVGSSNGEGSLSNEQRRAVVAPLVSEGGEEWGAVHWGSSAQSDGSVERQLAVVEINCEDNLVLGAVNYGRKRHSHVGIVALGTIVAVGVIGVVGVVRVVGVVAAVALDAWTGGRWLAGWRGGFAGWRSSCLRSGLRLLMSLKTNSAISEANIVREISASQLPVVSITVSEDVDDGACHWVLGWVEGA
jgi:hypothetical protein